MGKYIIKVSRKGKRDLEKIYKSGNKQDISRIEKIFQELEIHPREGSGQPEKLKYFDADVWSRRINKKDRLMYYIFDEKVIVLVVSALGHYNDK